MSYSTVVDGAPQVFREGMRLRWSTGIPRRHPEAWVADGSIDHEIGRAKAALLARANGDA